MQRAAAAPVNSRSTVQVTRQNNGVHPANEGYRQIADSVWAFLKNQF
jgi:lysophospholipase L1-like esterase